MNYAPNPGNVIGVSGEKQKVEFKGFAGIVRQRRRMPEIARVNGPPSNLAARMKTVAGLQE